MRLINETCNVCSVTFEYMDDTPYNMCYPCRCKKEIEDTFNLVKDLHDAIKSLYDAGRFKESGIKESYIEKMSSLPSF